VRLFPKGRYPNKTNNMKGEVGGEEKKAEPHYKKEKTKRRNCVFFKVMF
jgi:hypothetical protein